MTTIKTMLLLDEFLAVARLMPMMKIPVTPTHPAGTQKAKVRTKRENSPWTTEESAFGQRILAHNNNPIIGIIAITTSAAI
jgi:hypothetical protein